MQNIILQLKLTRLIQELDVAPFKITLHRTKSDKSTRLRLYVLGDLNINEDERYDAVFEVFDTCHEARKQLYHRSTTSAQYTVLGYLISDPLFLEGHKDIAVLNGDVDFCNLHPYTWINLQSLSEHVFHVRDPEAAYKVLYSSYPLVNRQACEEAFALYDYYFDYGDTAFQRCWWMYLNRKKPNWSLGDDILWRDACHILDEYFDTREECLLGVTGEKSYNVTVEQVEEAFNLKNQLLVTQCDRCGSMAFRVGIYAGFHIGDTYGVWGLSTSLEQASDLTFGENSNFWATAYLVISPTAIKVNHWNGHRDMLEWHIVVQDPKYVTTSARY